MCICGHGQDEHEDEWGECEYEGCLCTGYEDDKDEMEYA